MDIFSLNCCDYMLMVHYIGLEVESGPFDVSETYFTFLFYPFGNNFH